VTARRKAPYRGVIFGSAAAAGPVAWQWAGEAGHAGGLAALTVAGLVVVPVVMLAVITTPVALAKAAVPKRLRRWWRRGGHWWRPGAARHPRPKALLVRMVRAADRNRCVGCGITQAQLAALNMMAAPWEGQRRRSGMQLDHFFPFALGGNLILWNLFLLCPRCNQIKSNYWRDPDTGRVTYRPFWGLADRHEAARIARLEWLHRFNLARWWRAAWAL
jgi:hypothetical protein